jgi:hypothetical protein
METDRAPLSQFALGNTFIALWSRDYSILITDSQKKVHLSFSRRLAKPCFGQFGEPCRHEESKEH